MATAMLPDDLGSAWIVMVSWQNPGCGTHLGLVYTLVHVKRGDFYTLVENIGHGNTKGKKIAVAKG